jgi:hypothetical protein
MNAPPTNPTPPLPEAEVTNGRRSKGPPIEWLFYIGAFVSLGLLSGIRSLFPALLLLTVMVFSAFSIARKRTGIHRLAAILALLFPAMIMTGMSYEVLYYHTHARRADLIRAHTDTVNIAAAIHAYSNEYGSLPPGNDVELIRALLGDNPRKIVFYATRASGLSAAGDLLDPWGTPYHLDLSDPKNPKVYSFGKTKRAEVGAEDYICNWK